MPLAVGVARFLIGHENIVLLVGREAAVGDLERQVAVECFDALEKTGGREKARGHAHRGAGVAGFAGRAVDHVVAAAETGAGQRTVDLGIDVRPGA